MPSYVGMDTFRIKVNSPIDSGVLIVYTNVRETAPPVAVHNVEYCQYTADTALFATGSSLLWYTSSTSGLGSTLTPIPSTAVVGATRYYVSQTLNGCESLRDSAFVVIRNLPLVSVSPTMDTICSGQSTIFHATGGITYSWSPSSGLNLTSGGVVSASPNLSQTYYVTGSDSFGCSNMTSSFVLVNPTPEEIVITGLQQVTCIGVQTTLTDGTAGGTWSGSNDAVAAINSITGTVIGVDTGEVTFRYTLPATGCYRTTNMSVHPYDYHLPPVSTCIGTPKYVIDSYTGYQWGQDLGNSLGIHYSNYVYSTGGGCQVSFVVTVFPYPSRIAGDSILCIGDTSTLHNDSLGTWISNNSSVATISPAGLVTGLSAGTAIVTFTPVTNCPRIIHITVNPLPTINVTPTTSSICFGQSAGMFANIGLIYTWSPATSLSNSTGTSVTATPSVTTTYTVIGTNTSTGCSNSTIRTIGVNSLPSVNVTSSASTVCAGTNTTLSATGTLNYIWSPATALSSTIGTTVQAHPSVTTVYTVTGSDINGCSNKATVGITALALPTLSISPTSVTICTGQATTLAAFGADSYSWSPSASLSSSTAATITAIPASSTTYILTGVGTNGCANTINRVVVVNPTPTINPISNIVTCNGSTVSLSPFSGTAASYNWVNSNSAIGISSSGVGNIPTFSSVNNGTTVLTATITVTPSSGVCVGSSISFTITVKPSPTVTAISNQNVCNGAVSVPILFSGSAISGTPTTYNWVNSNSTIGLATSGSGDIGIYSAVDTSSVAIVSMVTVTPVADGCSGVSQNFTITVHPSPTVSVPSNQSLCNGSLTTLISISGTVPGTAYSWSCSDSAIGVAGSGIGNITSFTTINSGSTP
ncbi:Ig-like domain-containing protein [Flavipsychrobacter stenotrophus]|nr:Ig-like domain-containing protein [Flavipsychrobacter stenotrophus]